MVILFSFSLLEHIVAKKMQYPYFLATTNFRMPAIITQAINSYYQKGTDQHARKVFYKKNFLIIVRKLNINIIRL